MQLDSLQLKNFRCFGELNITFHPELTVIVANNGKGKTAILDAARIALWPYLHGFDLANVAAANADNAIKIDDVMLAWANEDDLVRHLPSSVKATGNVLDITQWERTRLKESAYSKTIDDVNAKALGKAAAKLQAKVRQTEQPQQSLPMLGYYGTGRLWDQKKRKKESRKRTQIDNSLIRTYGYVDCLDPASSFKMFEDWFIKIFKAHHAEVLKQSQRDNRLVFSFGTINTKYFDAIAVVSHALDIVLAQTEWGQINYDAFSEALTLTNKQDGTPLEIRQLSDGLRAVIGLVSDIAYRCYQLNKHLGVHAALETKGIVLIDEVDMHLHPFWQQRILQQLREAFKCIQFIVTTHSPQVLSTVPRKHIRVMIDDADGHKQAQQPGQEVSGLESAIALNDVMGVNPIPPVDEARLIADYTAVIENGQHESAEGRALREQLLGIYGAGHPVLRDADRLIRFQSFKLRQPPKAEGEH